MVIAARARARFAALGALLGLTLLAGHEAPHVDRAPRNHVSRPSVEARALGRVIVPGPFADAATWPRGMVIAPPETGDPMAFGVVPAPAAPLPDPLVTLLSGLFELLGSRSA